MNLSDLGSGSVSASASVPGGGLGNAALGAASDPQSAIAQGEGLFNSAYAKAGGSITGTVAVAASIVAELPAGPAKEMLNQVLGMASGAAAGAAIGSVIPGWGTAVGAAVGAIIGLVETISAGAGTEAPPEGDDRSTAEKYVFPPVAATPGGSDPESLLQQNSANPASWVDVRTWSTGYQVPYDGVDPANNGKTMQDFTFGTSWVSPPASTPTSKQAAWYVAQAWIGQNEVTRAYALANPPIVPLLQGGGDLQLREQAIAGARERAGTLLGSDLLTTRAIARVSRWYGSNFKPKGSRTLTPFTNWQLCAGVNTPQTTKPDRVGLTYFQSTINVADNGGGIGFTPGFYTNADSYGGPQPTAGTNTDEALQAVAVETVKQWSTAAKCLAKYTALDFTYYISPNLVFTLDTAGWNQTGGGRSEVMPARYLNTPSGYNATFFCSMPDTILVGLAELACLIELGVLAEAGADHVALQYLMSLAWLWRRGQEEDIQSGVPGASKANHPNLSRVIGILSGTIHGTKGSRAKASAAAKATKARARTATEKKQEATERAIASRGRQTTTLAPRLPSVLVAAPTHHYVRDLLEAVLVAAVAGAVVTYARKGR